MVFSIAWLNVIELVHKIHETEQWNIKDTCGKNIRPKYQEARLQNDKMIAATDSVTFFNSLNSHE